MVLLDIPRDVPCDIISVSLHGLMSFQNQTYLGLFYAVAQKHYLRQNIGVFLYISKQYLSKLLITDQINQAAFFIYQFCTFNYAVCTMNAVFSEGMLS